MRHASAILVLAAITGWGCQKTEQRIIGNGAWADDGSAVLLVESRYRTQDPSRPYFADPTSGDWRIAFLEADASLQGRTERAVFADLSPSSGGAIQGSQVYWLRAQGKVVASQYGRVFVFDLAGPAAQPLWLPRDVALQLFAGFGGSGSTEHPEDGLVVGYAPSPTGSAVGIFYTLAYEGPGGALDLRFVHAIAFFRLDGTFISATRLSAWDGSNESLRLSPPAVGDPAPPGPPSGDMPLLTGSSFLWTKDGSAAQVVDVDRDDLGAFLSSSLAERVEVADAGVSQLSLVPAIALPTRGGAVSDTGRYLRRVQPPASPNQVSVGLGTAAAWTAFGDVPLVPLDQIDYAL